MKQDDIRNKLIEATIQVIARDGLDKASTKSISQYAGVNEVYIYRCFADKEDMFAKAFDVLDGELVSNILENVAIMYVPEIEYEQRCRIFFTAVWKLLICKQDRCSTFVQYYYSPYFLKFSVLSHKKRYAPVVEKFNDAFIDEAEVGLIMGHMLNVILDFALKVHNNQMPKDDSYAEHVFRVIYRSVEQYFKKGENHA